MKINFSINYVILLFFLAVLVGCSGSSKYMKPSPPDANYQPSPDKAMIVFMRPSGFGYAIDAGVLHVLPKMNRMVGIVSAKKKVAYLVDPGEHLFMVVSEAADFMKAHVDPGKTYYVNVRARMGVWKARFSLYPIRGEELGSSETDAWITGTSYVENTPLSEEWEVRNRSDIESKRKKYWAAWTSKAEDVRAQATLFADDGVLQ